MPEQLTLWRAKDRTSAAHLNEAWTMLRKIARIVGFDLNQERSTNNREQLFQLVLGRVNATGPAGEADYTDERYWIREVAIAHGALPTTQITFENFAAWTPADGGADIPVIHTVSNLPELLAHSHNLPVDTPVLYLRMYDRVDAADENSRPNSRRVMAMGGAESKGEFMDMAHVMVAQNVDGWDFPKMHAERV